MCGIVVYFSTNKVYNKDITKALKELMFVNTIRGYHSTGITYGMLDEKEPSILKKAFHAPDFLELPKVEKIFRDFERTNFVIGHNRQATHGKVSHINAHPFQHGAITGVHNGTLFRWGSLTDQQFGTDSENIFYSFSDIGVKETVPKLDGTYALVWHNSETESLHILRNEGRDFCIAVLADRKDTIIGASEQGMLKWILDRNGIKVKQYLYPKPLVECIFEKDNITAPKAVKHTPYVAPKITNNSNYNYNNNNRAGGYSSNNFYSIDVDFQLETFTPYNVHGTGKPLREVTGKFEGKTIGGNNKVIIYNCKGNDFNFKNKYKGIAAKNYYAGAAFEVKKESVRKLKRADKGFNITKIRQDEFKNKANRDDDPRHIEVECSVCTVTRGKFADFLYTDNSPICPACITAYDIPQDELETFSGFSPTTEEFKTLQTKH